MTDFESWIDNVLEQELSEEIQAICFNIYDDGDGIWSVEFVGAGSFDENDDEWPCDEVFTNREEPYIIEEETEWNDILNRVIDSLLEYLESGKYADKLKCYRAVATGFVDGDLVELYKKQ